jgi:parallel beta-helix repeat protein
VIKAFYILLPALLIQLPGISQVPLPAVINKDTLLTEEGSPYYIKQNVSINAGITLKISEGTEILISDGVSITNLGRLIVQGSETKQVLFISDSPETRWNYISNEGSLYASYTTIRRAVRFVSSSGDTLVLEHCDISDTYGVAGDDCIAAHDAKKVIISNTRLTGNPDTGKTDAIDLDGVSGGTVRGNTISGYSDDGIDIGTGSSNMVVAENEIHFCDMGISVGEGSTVLAYKNLVSHSNAGIQSHTGAIVDARLNTLYGNNYGIRAFHYDGEESSGGNILVSSSIITGSILGDAIGVSNSTTAFEYTLTDLKLLAGTGNVTGDPGFLDVDNGNFHLSASSDAIDAGNPDLDGDGVDYLADEDDRDPDGTRLDMGCYPYSHTSMEVEESSPLMRPVRMDPSGEVLFLDLEEETGTSIHVGIFTITGILIRSMDFQAAGGMETKVWNPGIRNAGAYVIRVTAQGREGRREGSQLLIFPGGPG